MANRMRRLQAGLAAGAVALYVDERGLIRPWRWVRHTVRAPADVSEEGAARALGNADLRLRMKARPPPIGCTEWPAGRVLLQWAVGEVPPAGARVLEIGAGVGVTSLGLAQIFARIAGAQGTLGGNEGQATAIIATDVCEASLDNLRGNARANGIVVREAADFQGPPRHGCIHVGAWDAASGEQSVQRLQADLGIDPKTLTHIIGGDVIYHGFCDGLVRTLAILLRANPNINVTLLLVDRFSGGAVAAVSQVRLYARCLPLYQLWRTGTDASFSFAPPGGWSQPDLSHADPAGGCRPHDLALQ